MASELLPEDLWRDIAPLLPKHREQPKGGHPFRDDRLCLRGLIFILRQGIAYQSLPHEAFGVSGSTCWRRMQAWNRAGVWLEVHDRLLRALGKLGKVQLNRAVVDSQSVRAVFGGRTPGRTLLTAEKTGANATC